MPVDHELAQRPVQARQRAPEHHEARAGQLGRGLEVHEAEALTQLEVLLGLEVQGRPFSDLAFQAVGALVWAVGHVGGRRVGQA